MAELSKRSWRLPAFITLSVVTVLGWAPFGAVLTSGLVATVFGCTLNEAGAHPCVVAGYDFGELLYVGGVSGWFMLVTWPLMLITLVAWLALAGVFVMRRVEARRARGAAVETPRPSI